MSIDLNGLSNRQLDFVLDTYVAPNRDGVTPYFTTDWNATMPIAIQHGLDIELPDSNLGDTGTITKYKPNDTDVQVDFGPFCECKDPLRAVVICLIKFMDGE